MLGHESKWTELNIVTELDQTGSDYQRSPVITCFHGDGFHTNSVKNFFDESN